MQTGRLGATDVATQTTNVVFHAYPDSNNTSVVSINIVNRGNNEADFGVCVSTTDEWSDVGTVFEGILNSNDVYFKGGVFVDSDERVIVRSFQGELSATVWGSQKSIAQQPVAAPAAYTIPISRVLSISGASVDEPGNINITLATTGIINGTTIGYTITGVSSADINNAPLTGTLTVNNNFANLSLSVVADETPEGPETFTITLDTGESASIVINDTSDAPPATFITGDGGSVTESGSYTIHSFNSNGSSTFTIIEDT